jgi:ABC-2 type transport system ATP-binding protein
MVETPAFYEYLSGRKNLELVGRLRGQCSRADIDTGLEVVGLAERQHDKVATYSHGMKQRLGLAAALLGTPRLLLLDEPTNGLDPEGTRDILTLLSRKVRQERLAVFLSSHLLAEVEEFCDRVVMMDRGRLVAAGSVRQILAPLDRVVQVTFAGRVPAVADLLQEPELTGVELVSADTIEFRLRDRDSVWLNRYLIDRGWPVAAVRRKERTLREFFLSHARESDRGQPCPQDSLPLGRQGGTHANEGQAGAGGPPP